MKERSKRRDRSASANNRRKERREEVEKQLRFSLSLLISCFDFHKMSIILNHAGPLLLDSLA